jgi:cytochrome P450
MPVFHRSHVDAFAASLHDTASAHFTKWERQARLPDLYDAVQRLGAAAVLAMGYGLDAGDARAARLGDALIRYKQVTMSPRRLLRLDRFDVGLAELVLAPAVVARMWWWMRDVRRALRAAITRGAARGQPNWIDRLAAADLSPNALALEVNHLYGAFNAIDYVLTAAIYELARGPKLAESLRREIRAGIPEGAVATREHLACLPATRGFMLEILRRYPVTVGVVRETGGEIELGGERLPPRTQVLILLHALHHHPDFWDEPERLEPSRWRGTSSPRVPFSYVPFLLGPRKCIGRDAAEHHLFVVLTALVRVFDVEVFGEAVVPPFMIPRFARPIPFALRRAASASAPPIHHRDAASPPGPIHPAG